MEFDPRRAAIIQARLDITRDLDNDARLSFLERAHLRLDLMTALDAFDSGKADANQTDAALDDIRQRMKQCAATA
ncbi:hypothetical protein [Frondihabitans australicus]|uniref:Uncharacterized protein n=1 Tax=Frondihabitans australicus TaxID=386892 RepID=A0A495IF16_9MICO|nr:hypothetical protein [Frondihabitans australicus]RKR74583.1 hypothetical protein C8E83_1702 [Frondihabitans australicus]